MLDAAAPATRREQGKAERRARIIEAATALLRESGFDAVSMLQIAERADVSPATVYNLFQTKAAILQQVFDQDLRDYEQLRPDVTLLDVDLGSESGFAVAELLHRTSTAPRLPVILMSIHDEQELAELIAASPAAGFMHKFALNVEAIRDVLENSPSVEKSDHG